MSTLKDWLADAMNHAADEHTEQCAFAETVLNLLPAHEAEVRLDTLRIALNLLTSGTMPQLELERVAKKLAIAAEVAR